MSTTVRGTRRVARGTMAGGRWVGRRVLTVRDRGAAGEAGMTRLFDLHAASCAGDTLVTIGLAGTIFFSVPAGEARGKVALYLLVTMIPFALLAPIVGPLLDRFRHGRRYALAATMLGRAFLAWLISDYIHGFGLYPAAFGVLALSRAYGVARSAAVPRLLPARLGLSEAGARASVYGTIAGACVLPLGLLAFTLGPQWPLRVASVLFLVGMVFALRLPPRADSDPPETVPAPFQWPWRAARGPAQWPWRSKSNGGGIPKVLSGRLVVAAVTGSAIMRALYGFLLLFLAFSVKAGDLPTRFVDVNLSTEAALGLVGGALAVGTFLSTAVGTRLRIRRPIALQAFGMILVATVGTFATFRFSLAWVTILCLTTAIASGLAKLAVDASIQERVDEDVRASAFAHSETLLMLAWVAGGAIGLIPVPGRIGIGVAAGLMVLAAVHTAGLAARTFADRLRSVVGGHQPTQPAQPARPTQPAEQPPTRQFTARPLAPVSPAPPPAPVPPPVSDDMLAPPGYHLYRPTSAEDPDRTERGAR